MNPFFGDVVIYKSNNLESKISRPFIGEYTHSALRLNKNTAQSLDYLGKLKHDLVNPKEIYDEYIILRHKRIDQRSQKVLSKLNRMTNSNYDLKLILEIGLRKLRQISPNKENLYNKGKSNCASRIAHMYEIIDLEVNPWIHFSQIEPAHFLSSPDFKIVGEWKR